MKAQDSVKKIPLEQIDFLYEAIVQKAIDTLFSEGYQEHGWTYDEYIENLADYLERQKQPMLH
jgi:hypothetical protein